MWKTFCFILGKHTCLGCGKVDKFGICKHIFFLKVEQRYRRCAAQHIDPSKPFLFLTLHACFTKLIFVALMIQFTYFESLEYMLLFFLVQSCLLYLLTLASCAFFRFMHFLCYFVIVIHYKCGSSHKILLFEVDININYLNNNPSHIHKSFHGTN